ncbi:MAG: zf-TFIIB domain-containing protein [Deltaproteobacteria bacterium]|nr:zf-TFIIB domain-containing protein [Deltaproteobacteria bacterium]
MKCPIDNVEMKKVIYEADVEIDQCEVCGGVYLDAGELEAIQDARENDYSDYLERETESWDRNSERIRQSEEALYVCPGCGDNMIKKEYASHSGIQIDICPECRGIWLDAGELQELEIFFEKARKDIPDYSRAGLFFSGIKRFFTNLR